MPCRPPSWGRGETRALLLELAEQQRGELFRIGLRQPAAGTEQARARGQAGHHHLGGRAQRFGELLGRLVEQIGGFEELLLQSGFKHVSGARPSGATEHPLEGRRAKARLGAKSLF
jgi:hypothetical protein